MKGILFKPEMIKAIVEGKKTVTRRLLNPQPSDEESLECGYFTPALEDKNGEQYPADYEVFGAYTSDGEYSWKPRFLPGDIVYIKEAWATDKEFDHLKPSVLPRAAYIHLVSNGVGDYPLNRTLGKLRSPMFLPEKFARYFLKIVAVRPERLQEITEADAVREGCKGNPLGAPLRARLEYQTLWDSINKKTPWASNPWVWRIELVPARLPCLG